MYCSNCGAEINDGGSFCSKCDDKSERNKIPTGFQDSQPKKLSGFARASLVFGILGSPLFAFIFGFIAIYKIRKNTVLRGTNIAVMGMVISVILLMFIRTFCFQAFKIPGNSMHPTLQTGDRLIANKLIYHQQSPKRGELIIFKFPSDTSREFIKRLVGLPGEKVKIAGGKIYIDGKEITDGHEYFNDEDMPEITVPTDSYFVLGDNSANSYDSRYWGFVPRENITGKASFIYWPGSRFGTIR